jgi:hypothetical protein
MEPRYPVILLVDAEASSGPSDPAQGAVRDSLYDLLCQAFQDSGIQWPGTDWADRGDGVYLLIPPTVTKVRLIHPLVSRVDELLGQRTVGPARSRLRIALHGGEVTLDELDLAFALLNSDAAGEALGQAQGARCVLIVSDEFYQGVILHGHGPIEPTSYRVRWLKTRTGDVKAWLHVPGLRGAPEPEAAGSR